jgi:hypothetical protein
MKRSSTKQRGKAGKAGKLSDSGLLNEAVVALDSVWTGSIARLRIYHSTGRVFAYKAPGHNSDGVGMTDDPNIIHALFLSRDNGRPITGYSDNSGFIGWLDY